MRHPWLWSTVRFHHGLLALIVLSAAALSVVAPSASSQTPLAITAEDPVDVAQAARSRALRSPLPPLNAALNAAAALCLIAGYIFIRRGQREAHRVAMLTAIACSTLFLVFYLIHHAQVGSVRYAGNPAWRSAYLALLLTHTLLAAGSVPLVLVTLGRAWTGRFSAHRQIARWTLPLWLYVSVTGVIIYFVLYRL